jgi:geranylgeranyl pyrophosphate synthase
LALDRDRRLINAELRLSLRFGRDVPWQLVRAMRYAVLGPGKRIRPILCLESFRATGGRHDLQVLPFCCGLEFIHTFSLIHDDLPAMDDDDLRRGRPTLHRKFDEALAILAADGLFAQAYELFTRGPGLERQRLLAAAHVSRACGPAGMTGGQVLDVASAGRGRAGVQEIQRKKTAEFIAACVVAGAILGGASAARQRRLWDSSMSLGLLFQMTDDLLDSAQVSDESRATLPSAFGAERARELARAEAERARAGFASLGPKYELLAAVPELVLNRSR